MENVKGDLTACARESENELQDRFDVRPDHLRGYGVGCPLAVSPAGESRGERGWRMENVPPGRTRHRPPGRQRIAASRSAGQTDIATTFFPLSL